MGGSFISYIGSLKGLTCDRVQEVQLDLPMSFHNDKSVAVDITPSMEVERSIRPT